MPCKTKNIVHNRVYIEITCSIPQLKKKKKKKKQQQQQQQKKKKTTIKIMSTKQTFLLDRLQCLHFCKKLVGVMNFN